MHLTMTSPISLTCSSGTPTKLSNAKGAWGAAKISGIWRVKGVAVLVVNHAVNSVVPVFLLFIVTSVMRGLGRHKAPRGNLCSRVRKLHGG